MKQFNRTVAMYISCCVEVREDDGQRDLMTIRLLTLTWLFALISFFFHPYLLKRMTFTLTYSLVILLTLVFLRLRLLGKIPTPLGVLN